MLGYGCFGDGSHYFTDITVDAFTLKGEVFTAKIILIIVIVGLLDFNAMPYTAGGNIS